MALNPQITLGDVDNIYTKTTVRIPAGQFVQIDGVHTFKRIFSASQNISIAAQNSGIFQPISEGTWLKNPMGEDGKLIKLPYFRIKNESNQTAVVTVGFGNGEIGDDSIIGIISASEDNPVFSRNVRATSVDMHIVTIGDDGRATWSPSPDMKDWILQNQSGSDVFLWANEAGQGFKVSSGSSFSGDSADIVNMAGTAGGVVVIVEGLIL